MGVAYSEADGVTVNDVSTVVEADIGETDSIGVLHGVDAVILGGFTPCPAATTKAPTATPTAAPSIQSPKTFIEEAAATGNYDTLLDLVTNTPGVLDAITDNAPVTVFGPQDAAFVAISDTTAGLTEAELADILAAHVVAGEFRAADVIAAGCVELPTLNPNEKVKVAYSEADGVTVNDVSTVVEADIGETDSIGVLHGVDAVILGGFTPCPAATTKAPTATPTAAPSIQSPKTFIEEAAATGNYDTLLDLVTNTPGVLDAITDNAPVTVFGPQDA